jgi:translation initiation factor 2 subunit 1
VNIPYPPGYIDLSKRRVSPEDITKCEERYMKSKTVASIMRHVASKLPSIDADTSTVDSAGKEPKRPKRARKDVQDDDAIADEGSGGVSNEEERLEHLYGQITWPLGKIYGHPYDAFKLALTLVSLSSYLLLLTMATNSEQDTVFNSLQNPIPPATLAILMSTIARRLTPQPIKLRADIELTCYTPAGIDAIKKALRAGEKESSEAVPIKAKLVAPPLYVLTTNATDKVHIPMLSYCATN